MLLSCGPIHTGEYDVLARQLLQVLNGSKDIKTVTNPGANCLLKPLLTALLTTFALTLTTLRETSDDFPIGSLEHAALLHKGKLVSKKQDEYVTTAATVPRLHKRLIIKSQRHNPLIPNDWSDDTFEDIDWKSVRSSIKRQPVGRSISNLPSLPTTGLQPYINALPKTTASTNDVSSVVLGKKILTMFSDAQATYVMQLVLKPRPSSSTT